MHPGPGNFWKLDLVWLNGLGGLIDLSDVSMSNIIYSNSQIVVIRNISDCQFSLQDCLHEMLFTLDCSFGKENSKHLEYIKFDQEKG